MNYAALFSWQATAGCSPPPVCRLRHQLFVPLVALYKHASEGGKKPLFSRTFFSNGDTSPLGYSANTKSSIGWDGTGDGPLLLLHLNGQREKTEGLVPTDIIECLCALFSLVGRREAPHYSFSSSPFFAHSHCRRIAVRCNPNTPTMSAEEETEVAPNNVSVPAKRPSDRLTRETLYSEEFACATLAFFFFSARGSAERPRNKERGASGGGRETEGNILSLALFQKSVRRRPTASFLSLCTVKSHTLTHWIAVAAVAFALCPCSSPSLAVAAAGCVFGVRSPAALMKLCPMRTNNPTELW